MLHGLLPRVARDSHSLQALLALLMDQRLEEGYGLKEGEREVRGGGNIQ